jgi:hypothetical protein
MTQNRFSMHLMTVWGERAGDPRLPKWLRLASLAFSCHDMNGHAPFTPGEISLVLSSVDDQTGEILPMDKSNLQRALRKAIEFGWLTEASSTRCLVVPAHAIEGGRPHRSDRPCPFHTRKRSSRQKPGLRAVS